MVCELFNVGRLEETRVLCEGLTRNLAGEVGVDEADVGLTLHPGNVGRLHVSLCQPVPIDGLEEGMRFHLLNRQSFFRVPLQQASEEGGGVGAEASQDLNVLLSDRAQDLMPRLFLLHRLNFEGIDPADHLVEQHAKRPQIDTIRVTFPYDHFRRKILWSAAES